MEAKLENRVKRQLLDEVRSICPPGVTIMHVRQGEAKGLGHAILCAYPLIGDESFAVVLPDVLIDNSSSDLTKDNLANMVRAHKQTGHSQILVEPIKLDDVSKYGVVDCNGKYLTAGYSAKVFGLVEKPSSDEAPSNIAIVGRYILGAEVWGYLRTVKPGKDDEIQLTDAIEAMLQNNFLDAFCLQCWERALVLTFHSPL